MYIDKITQILGEDATLLKHRCQTIQKDVLHLPGPDFADRIWVQSDRSAPVIRNMQSMFNHGRLAGTGYLSILPVDQGVEHSAGASFAPNPIYFDPANIVKLAIEGGCNAVASTVGVLGIVSRSYAHKIPFIAKINHNELLSYPESHDQILFGSVEHAFDLGAVGVGATIYFGSEQSNRQIQEISEAFQLAHELGMFTVLWCYVRNEAFIKDKTNYETSADLTGQANHLGATIQADIIKQKQPTVNGGYKAVNFGKTRPLCMMTGRGYHFIWRIKKTTNAFERLAGLGRLNAELTQRYELNNIPVTVGKAFCGAGLIMEYLMHRVRQRLGNNSEIPVNILEVVVSPQQRGREIISLDISEYADPLDTRFVRVPFSNYMKPYWKPGIMTPQTKDKLPSIFIAPVTGEDFETMVHLTQDANNMQSLARDSCAAIPEMAAAMESLIYAYNNSSLRSYHDYFYQVEQETLESWPDTYDRTDLDSFPSCVRHILQHPNDLLLSPGAIRLVTAALLAADWHPRHIAGLIRSKYERDYGWLNEWYIYDAGTRADFYTRVFAGLIYKKLDDLQDLNCSSLKGAGLCRQVADCGTDMLAARLGKKELAV